MSNFAPIPTAGQELPISTGAASVGEMIPEDLQPVEPITGIQVVLRSLDNRMYVMQAAGGFAYTDQLGQALVFDLVEDRVFQSIYDVRKELGHTWVAWPLKVETAFERCDGCNNFFEVAEVIMQEHSFLCGNCHERQTGNASTSPD